MPGSLRFVQFGRGWPILGIAFGLALAVASSAADLRDVRVGLNKDYTRVVLETDSKAPYTLRENDGSVTLQVQATARPQAVAAKGPHVAWVRVEPAGTSATVKLELRGPARIKQMVLTGPNRIVIDVYADESAAAAPVAKAKPRPAPVVPPAKEPQPAPAPVVAETKPPEAATSPRPDDEAALLREADAMLGPAKTGASPEGEEIAANEGAAEAPEGASLEGADQAVPSEAVPAPAEEKAPSITHATKKSRGILGVLMNPYLLGVLAVAMLGVFVILVKRRPAAELPSESAAAAQEEAPLFPMAERGEAAGEVAAAQGGETEVLTPPPSEPAPASSFDFEAPSEPEPEKPDLGRAQGAMLSTIGSVTSTAAYEPPPPGAPGGLTLSELERRLALLETRLEEVIDAKDRLERQVSAQTEELRVQRAAIARTQRVLRTVVRPDDEPSEPVLKS